MQKSPVYLMVALGLVTTLFAPPASALAMVYPAGGEYLRGTVTVQWSSQNAAAAEVTLFADGAQVVPDLCSACTGNSFVWDTTKFADGTDYVIQVKQDASGGNPGATVTTSGAFTVDNHAPSTLSTLDGAAGTNGWYTGDVAVALAGSDATSGVARTLDAVDGAALGTYAGSFRVSGDGTHTVSFQSVDRAGNVEALRGVSFNLDSTAPASRLAIGAPNVPAGRVTYVTSATPLTLSATDATSGVARIEARLDGGAFAPVTGALHVRGADGEHLLEWRAVDGAGNVETPQYLKLFLDNTAPDLAIAHPQPGGVYVDDTLIAEVHTLAAHVAGLGADDSAVDVDTVPFAVAEGALTVTAATSDAGSGVGQVQFLVDGTLRSVATAAPYQWTWDTSGEVLGEHTLTVVSIDRLGNAATQSQKVEVVPSSLDGILATVNNGGPNLPSFITGLLPDL